MAFNKILIDTNICLDIALFRKPFVSDALRVFEIAERESIELVIAAHTFDTIFYILRQQYSAEKAYQLIKELRAVSTVGPVSENIIDAAISLKWTDFEDAIHHLTALHSDCNAIITRDQDGFKNSAIPAFTPLEFLDQISI